MQAGPAPIPVYRPSYLTDGLEFQGSLVESPANVFYQRVKASRASLVNGSGRMQFQWRSVSDNLLMSPTVMLRFRIRIRSPVVWNQVLQYIAVRGVRSAKAARTEAQTYAEADIQAAHTGCVGPPAICFADGDAFTSCCSSINLTFNGTSLSLNRTNQFWRDYVRTQIASEDAARIYKSCGGAYDQNDAVGVAVPIYGADAVAEHANVAAFNTAAEAGITVDSGIAERCKNLYSLLDDDDGTAASGGTRILQVSYPVPVAPLNPWRGYAVPATSPYKSTPLAIPHFSAGGLDFLVEDFDKAFLRRMGVPTQGGDNAAYGDARNGGPITFELVDDFCELELKYFRLSHTRALKESYRFNVWQAQTFLGPTVSDAHTGDGHVAGRMEAIGKDKTTQTGGANALSYDQTNKTWKVKFDTINLAQVPSFLLVSAPRINSEYSTAAVCQALDAKAAATFPSVRNKSANLFIKSIRLQVNNAQGHIDKAGGSNEAYIMSERLFEMTRENAGSHYFKEGGFRAWRDSGMAVLLSSSQFAPGLMVSDGVAYPINLDVEMELQNRHVDVTALDIQGRRAHQLVADSIRAQAQATAIFTKIILATTETSATTNAMNYPLDSAERILNSAGSMR